MKRPQTTSGDVSTPPRPGALLLDLDGTLTIARLDFPLIKQEMGIGDRPILEAMAQMTPSAHAEATRIIDRHETEAAENSELAHGAVELFAWLEESRLPFAIVTRNSGRCLEVMRAKHSLPACVSIAREDAPYKPHPEPLRLACRRLGVDPQGAWMVGDGQFDIEAARAARMFCVWISRGRPERPFTTEPDRAVDNLYQLLELLRAAVTGTHALPCQVSHG